MQLQPVWEEDAEKWTYVRALKHAHAHGGGPKIKQINFELMDLRLFAMKSFYVTSMKYKYFFILFYWTAKIE